MRPSRARSHRKRLRRQGAEWRRTMRRVEECRQRGEWLVGQEAEPGPPRTEYTTTPAQGGQ
jgi:hypothetical protein